MILVAVWVWSMFLFNFLCVSQCLRLNPFRIPPLIASFHYDIGHLFPISMDVDQGISAEDVEEDEGIEAVAAIEWKWAVHA